MALTPYTGPGENQVAIDFLKVMQPDGPWALTCISTTKREIETETFTPDQEAECLAWLEKWNSKRNIYWHVNPVRQVIQSKAGKEDVARVTVLHVDIDPEGRDLEAEWPVLLARVNNPPAPIPPPSVVVFSGGGYQAFWFLEEPIELNGTVEAAEEAERYNRQIELMMGGDHCHNVDRLMRLPGTVNLPDKKKEAKGRVPTLARVEAIHIERVYPVSQFTPAPPKQQPGAKESMSRGTVDATMPGNVQRMTSLDELDEWRVPARVREIIAQGHVTGEEDKKDTSRSAWLFDALCQMARCGVPKEVQFAIITDPSWAISKSVLDKGSSAQGYAWRQVNRAQEHAVDPALLELNDKHAVIRSVGNKCRVMTEEVDEDDDFGRRSTLTFSSRTDFEQWYANREVQVGVAKGGKPIMAKLGKWWWENALRRQYDRVVFSPEREVPGCYNLWQGFAYDAVPGDCSLFLAHVMFVCGGDQLCYDYYMDWMARSVQMPWEPAGSAIVLRGEEGTGKGTIARIWGALFGRHFLQVTNSKHFVGNFNAHLRDCCALFPDEAFFAGDRSHESVLKTLVTEPYINIEAKGVDMEQVKNRLHIMMASNKQWVVPAGEHARRWFVLNVPSDHRQDQAYFSALYKQMEDGGYSALLHLLLTRDISENRPQGKFNPQDFPRTAAFYEQQQMTNGPEEDWWLARLMDGSQTHKLSKWEEDVPKGELFDDYLETARKFNVNRRGSESQLGRFMNRICPGAKSHRPLRTHKWHTNEGFELSEKRQVPCYRFPPLEECRAAFDKAQGTKTAWPPVEPVQPTLKDKDKSSPF